MFATTFFAIFVVPISRNPIVKPFLVLENGQIRDQLINSGKSYPTKHPSCEHRIVDSKTQGDVLASFIIFIFSNHQPPTTN